MGTHGQHGAQVQATDSDSGRNALHVAACCAGTAVLPDHGADFPDRTVSTCFDFRHTQRTAKAACPAMSGPSISWFNGHGVMQHCGDAHTSKLRRGRR